MRKVTNFHLQTNYFSKKSDLFLGVNGLCGVLGLLPISPISPISPILPI